MVRTMTERAIAEVISGFPREGARAIATQDFAVALLLTVSDDPAPREAFLKACGWADRAAHEAALDRVLK